MTTPVLIPTRRRPHLLERQVKAIREQEGDFEPLYLLTWQQGNGQEIVQGSRTWRLLDDLEVDMIPLAVSADYKGAETKSYNYDHLAVLWNRLLTGLEPPLLLMGSDVLPGEPDTLRKMMGQLVILEENGVYAALAVPVQVNEHGALNWFWPPKPRRREPYRATTDNTRFRDEVVPAARVTGGIIAFNYNPNPLQPGPGSEFYHLKNPCVYLGRTGINLRPDGQEWRIET